MSLTYSAVLCGETRYSKLRGAATKDLIACADLRSLAVCVVLIIQMKGPSAVGVNDCQFLVACCWFKPSTRKSCSSAQCRDHACIASFANTEINA